MYAKGMSTRHTAIILALNAEQAARFLTGNDQEMDELVLDRASQQTRTRTAELPSPNDTMVITISLTDEESQKLSDSDEDFEDHFLKIVTQQVENTQKDINRFECQKSEGYVPSRRERKERVTR